MATTAIHVQGGGIVVNPQAAQQAQQAQQQHQQRNLPTIKNLAITQLVIGILCVVFGIAIRASIDNYSWMTNTAAGLWAGGWILITGIIGIRSANVGVSNVNAVYLAFSIISTCASALAGLFFILAVIHFAVGGCITSYDWSYRYRYTRCGNRSVGLGLFVPLLILMVIEFFISIIAAVYSCQRGCNGTTGGVIIQPAQPTVSVVTTGQAGAYQYQMAPAYGVSVAQPYNQYPPPNSSVPPQYSGQPMFVQAQPYPMQQAQTNVVYSEKPPDYSAAAGAPPHY